MQIKCGQWLVTDYAYLAKCVVTMLLCFPEIEFMWWFTWWIIKKELVSKEMKSDNTASKIQCDQRELNILTAKIGWCLGLHEATVWISECLMAMKEGKAVSTSCSLNCIGTKISLLVAMKCSLSLWIKRTKQPTFGTKLSHYLLQL